MSPDDARNAATRCGEFVVIFQENRAFDHYFGAYQRPGGGSVTGILDGEGNVDTRFAGMQKNPAGAAYAFAS